MLFVGFNAGVWIYTVSHECVTPPTEVSRDGGGVTGSDAEGEEMDRASERVRQAGRAMTPSQITERRDEHIVELF